uniref:Pinin_SDK_memA domain-containing protein n=1 Tax=Rhodnius prolixus TaxID=13249 RepID=T1HKQ8_RHOPR
MRFLIDLFLRNRRMFGALIGHIQKFRQEENRLKEKERKKAEVEKKVEEAALREKEELKKKRQELFTSRRQQQQEIRQLEYKLMRMKQFSDWESTRKHLVNFIQTNTSPKIFYLPKSHNEKSKTLLEESRQRILSKIFVSPCFIFVFSEVNYLLLLKSRCFCVYVFLIYELW